MKIYITILFLLISQFILCQVKSGQIIYSVRLNDTIGSSNIDYQFIKLKNDMIREFKSIELELIFNQTKSRFSLARFLPIDLNNKLTKTAISLAIGKDVYYNDIEKRKVVLEDDFLGKTFLIFVPYDDLKWELTKEEKQIGKYICYKAIGEREYFNKDWKKKTYSVTAWYCPEITFPFGPFYSVALPGIVLELETGKYLYTAKNIKLMNEDVKIELPNFSEVITQEEYNNLYKAKIDELSKMN